MCISLHIHHLSPFRECHSHSSTGNLFLFPFFFQTICLLQQCIFQCLINIVYNNILGDSSHPTFPDLVGSGLLTSVWCNRSTHLGNDILSNFGIQIGTQPSEQLSETAWSKPTPEKRSVMSLTGHFPVL